MASNPPGECCFKGFYHEGTPKGTYATIYDVNTYVAGTTSPKDKVIVILTDVYGYQFNNANLIADQLAEAGFKVYIPDILFNDPIVELDGSADFPSWLKNHTPDRTAGVVNKFMSALKKDQNPKFIGVIGYCFGAKFAVQQLDSKTGTADVVAIAHPSFVSMEEIAAMDKSKPIIISAAENDEIFSEPLRHQTEDKLKEIGATYQLTLFSGVSHGFACRGDVSQPFIKYAKEKALADQIHWFNYFCKQKNGESCCQQKSGKSCCQ